MRQTSFLDVDSEWAFVEYRIGAPNEQTNLEEVQTAEGLHFSDIVDLVVKERYGMTPSGDPRPTVTQFRLPPQLLLTHDPSQM